MRIATKNILFLMVAAVIVLAAAAYAQEDTGNSTTRLTQGQGLKISGVIVTRGTDNITIRDDHGREYEIKLNGTTTIKEKKSNPFRAAKKYSPDQLVRGLDVDVEGSGDANGALVARNIRFTQTEYMVAGSVESRVAPVEGELKQTADRLTRTEDNAKHLSGEVDELSAISNAARGGAKAAQDTADSAVAGVKAANDRITTVNHDTNDRITAVDDYQVTDSVVVHFRLNSADLSEDARKQLDQIAKTAKDQKGYVVEVTGFASADGDAGFNKVLSQRRADSVVQYLADEMIPLRRIVTPFGYGTKMPVADNKTRVGREENRRVEVKILTSKGLTGSNNADAASASIRK